MPWRIAGWGKNICPILQASYEPISLVMPSNLFDLLLTFGVDGTSVACPALGRPSCLRECFLHGAYFWPVGLDPLG